MHFEAAEYQQQRAIKFSVIALRLLYKLLPLIKFDKHRLRRFFLEINILLIREM